LPRVWVGQGHDRYLADAPPSTGMTAPVMYIQHNPNVPTGRAAMVIRHLDPWRLV